MSELSQFMGGNNKACTEIVNHWSAGGISKELIFENPQPYTLGAASSNSGALTADTWSELVSETSAGVLSFVGLKEDDSTSRSIGIRIVLDGIAVFSADSAVESGANYEGMLAVGTFGATADIMTLDHIVFNQSLSISIRSSLTETGKQTLYYQYQLTE